VYKQEFSDGGSTVRVYRITIVEPARKRNNGHKKSKTTTTKQPTAHKRLSHESLVHYIDLYLQASLIYARYENCVISSRETKLFAHRVLLVASELLRKIHST